MTPNPQSPAAQQYEQEHHASYAQKVAAMEAQGLSPQQAQYYATLDDKVAQLEASGKQISLANAQKWTDSQIASNPTGFRQAILNLNPGAIATSLGSPIYSQGRAAVQALMEQNPGQSQYVVSYPDGSQVSIQVSPGTAVAAPSTVTPQGYSSDTVGKWTDSPGYYTGGYIKWSYFDGVSYSKVSTFNINYTLDSNPDEAIIDGYQTGQASYGIVGIANASGQITSNDAPQGSYAQVENQVVFDVSGAFSASMDALSISVNAGAYWTQYAIYDVWGGGWVRAIAAQYT